MHFPHCLPQLLHLLASELWKIITVSFRIFDRTVEFFLTNFTYCDSKDSKTQRNKIFSQGILFMLPGEI